MNPAPGPQSAYDEERSSESLPKAAEIPAYPVEQVPVSPEQAYIPSAPEPAQEQYQPSFQMPERAPIQQPVEQRPESVEQQPVTVERDTPFGSPETAAAPASSEGENAFQNLELGKSTFPGGVTATQLVSRVGGYPVSTAMVSDPHSGLLQQTAQTGDPTLATVWQTSILKKTLEAILRMLGLN